MKGLFSTLVAFSAIAFCTSGALAQSSRDREIAYGHMAAAQKAAGYQVSVLYDHTCTRLMVGASMPFGRITPADNDAEVKRFHAEPEKVFDNLYYVGEKMLSGASPSSWAINTTDGIILIDTMFDYSVEDEIVDGLKKLGLDPANIKVVILTHGHSDHVGGALYLQQHYHPKVYMGAADWDLVENNKNFRGPKPVEDANAVRVVDGQTVTLGGETIRMYVTPGHTPGTLTLLIPVTDHGTPHMAALWGGTGMQYSAVEYSKSAERFREIAADAGADVILSTHNQLDNSDIKLELLKKRQPGDPNPYVVGFSVVQDYLVVARECSAAAMLLPEEYKGYLGR
jgi:metallo-beta-lactamase class B